MLIGIAGRAGSGKDTLANYIVSIRPDQIKVHLASPIKHALNIIFNWDDVNWEDRKWKESVIPELGFSPRKAAQLLGTEWRDLIDPTKMLWCNALEARAHKHNWKLHDLIIPDVRFIHEEKWIHKHKGIVIYIHSTRHEYSIPNNHASENELGRLDVDYTLHNYGTITDLEMEFNNLAELIFK